MPAQQLVVPANAGTQCLFQKTLDPRFRGDDNRLDPRFRGDDNRLDPSFRGDDNRLDPRFHGDDNRLDPRFRGNDNRLDPRFRGDDSQKGMWFWTRVTVRFDNWTGLGWRTGGVPLLPKPYTHAIRRVVLGGSRAAPSNGAGQQVETSRYRPLSLGGGSAQPTGGPLEPSVPGSPRSTGTTSAGTRPSISRVAGGSSAPHVPPDAPPLNDRQIRQSTWL